MLKKLSFIVMLFLFSSCTTTQIQDVLGTVLGDSAGALTTAEIASGLKEALNIGIGKGSDRLSMTDGYYKSVYKILLPEEAQKVTSKLQGVPGFTQLEEVILEKINRGAEDAAKKAKPIFVNAIKQMTFADAMDILMGSKDAATNYLERTTMDQLYAEFNPIIVESLDKFNARKIWGDAVNAYNAIPFTGQQVNNDLDDYVTRQALKGLFSMVEKEERNIRQNVAARTSDLLKKVFAKQDGN